MKFFFRTKQMVGDLQGYIMEIYVNLFYNGL